MQGWSCLQLASLRRQPFSEARLVFHNVAARGLFPPPLPFLAEPIRPSSALLKAGLASSQSPPAANFIWTNFCRSLLESSCKQDLRNRSPSRTIIFEKKVVGISRFSNNISYSILLHICSLIRKEGFQGRNFSAVQIDKSLMHWPFGRSCAITIAFLGPFSLFRRS